MKTLLLVSLLSISGLARATTIRLLEPNKPEPVFVQEGDGEGANYGMGDVDRDTVAYDARTTQARPVRAGTKVYVLDSAVLRDENDPNVFRLHFGIAIAAVSGQKCEIPVKTKRKVYAGPCFSGWMRAERVVNIIP